MSKERAKRREQRLQEQREQHEARARRQARADRRREAVSAVAAPVRGSASAARNVWRPFSGGQRGILSRRRARRALTMAVIVAAVNIAVWLLFTDVQVSLTAACCSLVCVPVVGRLLFSRRY